MACACLWVLWYVPGAAVSALVALYAYLALVPVDKYVDSTEQGNDTLDTRGRSKRDAAREAMRHRRLGNMPPVYANGWCPVLESRKLRRAQVRLLSVLGENLVVFRGESGEVHVLDAYCPHLGANMAVGGKVVGDCLQCPFHAWRFSGRDGNCTSIPYSDKIPDIAKVRHWDSVEVNGLVFVWYHAEGEPPSWTVPAVAELRDPRLCYIGRSETIIQCHMQEILENGSDVSHFDQLHGTAVLGLIKNQWNSITIEPSAEPGQEHVCAIHMSVQPLLFGRIKLAENKMIFHQVGPYYGYLLWDSPYGPAVMTHSTLPMEPLLQRVTQVWYGPKKRKVGMRVRQLLNDVIEMDSKIWNYKTFIDKPLLVKEDKYIARYRRYCSQFYSENSPTYNSQRRSLDW